MSFCSRNKTNSLIKTLAHGGFLGLGKVQSRDSHKANSLSLHGRCEHTQKDLNMKEVIFLIKYFCEAVQTKKQEGLPK